LQIAIYKHGQINAIWQLIKIPLYRDFLQFIKTAKIIAILQMAIYKNGQIIAILQQQKNPVYREFFQFIKTAILLQ
jgi:hypothetical protein